MLVRTSSGTSGRMGKPNSACSAALHCALPSSSPSLVDGKLTYLRPTRTRTYTYQEVRAESG